MCAGKYFAFIWDAQLTAVTLRQSLFRSHHIWVHYADLQQRYSVHWLDPQTLNSSKSPERFNLINVQPTLFVWRIHIPGEIRHVVYHASGYGQDHPNEIQESSEVQLVFGNYCRDLRYPHSSRELSYPSYYIVSPRFLEHDVTSQLLHDELLSVRH